MNQAIPTLTFVAVIGWAITAVALVHARATIADQARFIHYVIPLVEWAPPAGDLFDIAENPK